MLTKIAWKNIWRNPVRSIILITAIALGIWALIFINGVSVGMVDGYVQNAIQNRTSHLQIHNPTYENEKEIGHYFNTTKVDSYLDKAAFVHGYTQRIIISGMVNSPLSSRAVMLYGVNPEKENEITDLYGKITEGDSLTDNLRNALLISQKMADKLGVKVRSKVVINFQNLAGEVTAAAFRVSGLIRNTAGKADDANAYVRRDVLQKLTGMKNNQSHETAILIDNLDQLTNDQDQIKSAFPDLSVKNYKELSPDVALMSSQINICLLYTSDAADDLLCVDL